MGYEKKKRKKKEKKNRNKKKKMMKTEWNKSPLRPESLPS